ncbi:MAG TPA: hypothetical protein DCR55_02120 [Lentisphaeria bacterium]|nr:hypothetical protein [Lentisphaeria bacterium]
MVVAQKQHELRIFRPNHIPKPLIFFGLVASPERNPANRTGWLPQPLSDRISVAGSGERH